MKVNQVGAVFKENVVCENRQMDATADAVFVEELPRSINSLDGCSYTVHVDDFETEVVVEDGDEAVSATDTLVIAGYDFTGQEGATVVVAGSEDNDGSYVVTTGADGSAVFSAATFVDEEFDPDTVTITVIRTDEPPEGTVSIYVSNSYVAEDQMNFGQNANPGRWVNLSPNMDPPPPAITDSGYEWYGDISLNALSIKIRVDIATGMGTVSIYYGAKGTL